MSTNGRTSEYNDALIMLTAMGFEQSQAQLALEIANGNAEYAANYLLSGGGGGEESNDSNNRNIAINTDFKDADSTSTDVVEQIQGSSSQYSEKDGRSACTFIALSAASNILSSAGTEEFTINQSFLDGIIQSGCKSYAEWAGKHRRDETQEHISVEEIFKDGYYSNVEMLPGEIRQGILSSDRNHPLGLHTCILSCQSLIESICVVMIKPPETILLCLPPKNSSSANDHYSKYCLIDSHPRMMEFGTEHAYCRIHVSLIDLVQSISKIFPVTDLGSDVPEYMSSMYNSYDLYALRSVKQRKGN